MPPYRPGSAPPVGWFNYNPHQQECWKALDSVYHAFYGGYIETRQPTPGRSVDPEKYNEWVKKFEAAWQSESVRDPRTRGLTAADLGDSAMRHLYERFSRAGALRQTSSWG